MKTQSSNLKPSFMMDHMVIRLGKYLRIAGYDAEWDLDLRTHDLIQIANITGRLFVTRNSHLAEQFPPVHALFFLTSTDPAEQFAILAGQLQLDTQSHLFSRCIRCNEELMAVEHKQDIRGMVHPNVFSRQDRFYRCPHCGTVFWHGSHVNNTCRKLKLPCPRPAA